MANLFCGKGLAFPLQDIALITLNPPPTPPLSSGEGQVIYVYGADYGRRDKTTCAYRRPTRQTSNTLCFSPTNKVADRYGRKKKKKKGVAVKAG